MTTRTTPRTTTLTTMIRHTTSMIMQRIIDVRKFSFLCFCHRRIEIIHIFVIIYNLQPTTGLLMLAMRL